MKAAIMTIYDISNYGNRLQNYAVQFVLNKMQLETVTYAHDSERITYVQKIKYLIQTASCYHIPGNISYWKYYMPKCMIFEKFNDRYIKHTYFKTIDEIDKNIDYFIIGSDQVWNPLWYDRALCKKDIFLLSFVEKTKKVCFSPSFGLERLPQKWEPWFKKNLEDFEYLSVRENAGAKIIKELTGREAEVLIDPTLMLSKDEWMKIAQPPVKVIKNEEYVFTYFLGGVSEKGKEDIAFLMQNYNYRIIDVLDMSKPEYMSDPSEFIFLIANAKMILTDSFHGCVFSFIFDKPFWVYDRVNGMEMNSRIETFLSKFDLKGRKRKGETAIDNFKVDYSKGKEILCNEKEKLVAFLSKSIKADRDSW